MDDSLFARLGYDPVRIHAHFHGQPALGGVARLGNRAKAQEAPRDGPEPVFTAAAGADDRPAALAEAPDSPPRDGAVAGA